MQEFCALYTVTCAEIEQMIATPPAQLLALDTFLRIHMRTDLKRLHRIHLGHRSHYRVAKLSEAKFI